MAAAVRAATSAEDDPRARVAALARTYLDFAAHNPAVYDALFRLDGGLAYAQEDTPEPLKDAFAALMECLGEAAGDGVDPGLFTEVFWSSLHGLATLTRADRLLPEYAELRVQLLVDRLAMARHTVPAGMRPRPSGRSWQVFRGPCRSGRQWTTIGGDGSVDGLV